MYSKKKMEVHSKYIETDTDTDADIKLIYCSSSIRRGIS